MGDVEDSIRKLIKSRYGTQKKFARKINMSESTLSSALNELNGTTYSTFMPIIAELGVNPINLAKGNLESIADKPEPVFVPLHGSIAAGTPIEMQEADDFYPIPGELHAAYRDAFLLRVRGNSMNRSLPNGSLVLIDPCKTIDSSGEMYALTVGNDDATVKKVIVHDNGITLQPDSNDPTYKPQLYDYSMENAPDISVIGRVVWWCSPASPDPLA